MKLDDFVKVLDGLKEEVLSLETQEEGIGKHNEPEDVCEWMTHEAPAEPPKISKTKGKKNTT
jgi:hypothetical protein